MESLITLLKILLFVYLGCFTYISYQIIFNFHKKFLVIKTLSFFFVISLLIIKISNKYDIIFFLGYIFFYCLGVYISKLVFKKKISENAKLVKYFLLKPSKKHLLAFVKKMIFFEQIKRCKKEIKLYFYYLKYPYKKPKTIYELF